MCVRKDVEHLTFITFQYTLHLGSRLHLPLCRPSILYLLMSLQPAVPFIVVVHPKRNNTVSSPALTMMHEPDGKHFSGVVIIKLLFFLSPFFPEGPCEKYKIKNTKTGPKV